MQYKTVPMEVKELAESGEFIGMASVFGNTDQGGDIVMPGSFSKTIADNGGKFPLLYGHRVNVGVSQVSEKAQYLECKGYLNLDIQPAKEVYSNMQHFKKHGMDFGMSIGFLPVEDKTKFKDGMRILHEVKLFENTLTEFPMNEEARVLGLKYFDVERPMGTLSAELESIAAECKAGRKLSAASRAEIMAAMEKLMALLDEEAAEKSVEPVNHSRALFLIEKYRLGLTG